MAEEVLAALAPEAGQVVVDCTLGGAGHARRLAERVGPDGTLIGIDQDRAAIANARAVFRDAPLRVHLVHDNFAHLTRILNACGHRTVDGILADLGLSLYQLEASGRGFSFQRDEPLDMRMDDRGPERAADLVNGLSTAELADLLRRYGQERWSLRIARAIVRERAGRNIATSRQLARIVSAAIPAAARRSARIHPATRVFMALRISVNRELERLETFLDEALQALRPGARLCVLSFHSLEDRIVKRWMHRQARPCICPPRIPRCVCQGWPRALLLQRKAQRPSESEVARNPMARSTRLRAMQKPLA